VAIPVKLPAPDLGTAEQAGPKSIAAAAREDPLAADAEDDAAGDDEPEDADELHAATPATRLTASPDTARRRYFMVSSLDIGSLGSSRGLRSVM